MLTDDRIIRLLLLISTKVVPREFVLHQSSPAPFSASSAIMFDVPTLSFITLKLYDILGNEVVTLANGKAYEPGRYEETLDTSHLPSGLYYYSLLAQSTHDDNLIVYHGMRKLELLK